MKVAAISEKTFQRQVIELAEALRWRVVHFRPGMNQRGAWSTAMSGTYAKGFPDLVLVRDRVVFAELKSAKGKQTEEQAVWGAAILIAGAEYYLWRPQDFERIRTILSKAPAKRRDAFSSF